LYPKIILTKGENTMEDTIIIPLLFHLVCRFINIVPSAHIRFAEATIFINSHNNNNSRCPEEINKKSIINSSFSSSLFSAPGAALFLSFHRGAIREGPGEKEGK
jgi:hypothetical protein